MTRLRKLNTVPYLTLFLLFFSYATAAALLFQNLMLPMVSGVHHGQGLIQGDSAYFHSVAVELAARIRADGWSLWTIYPTHGASGNVAVLAALYVWFGDAPSLMVPVNASLHALTGVLIAMLGRLLWPGRVGALSGVLASTLFIVFPSALNWYGQIHKDGFSIAGALLIVISWFWSERWTVNTRSALLTTILFLIGCGLIVFVRPYGLRLALVGMVAMALVEFMATWLWCNTKVELSVRKYLLKLVLLGLMGVLVTLTPKTQVDGDVGYTQWSAKRSESAEAQEKLGQLATLIREWRWQETPWLPSSLDRYMANIAHTRVGLIEAGILDGAGSMYDADRLPASSVELLAYLPRALQISMFAPFPSLWLEKLSPTRLVAVGEMFIWYLLAPGLLLLFRYRRSPALLALTTLAITMLIIYGVALANVGSLYRIRYLYLFLLILLSILGWVGFMEAKGWLRQRSVALATSEPVEPPERQIKKVRSERSALVSSGIIVAGITTVSFLGLFLRDVMMAQMFGLGSELDAFITGTVIPMFLVAVLSVPIGTAIVPALLAARQRSSLGEACGMAQRIGLYTLCGAVAIAIIVALLGSMLLSLAGWSFPADKYELILLVSLWMLAIFVVSGLVTLANGVLNALGYYYVPAAAQAVVPFVVILSLWGLGETYGVVVVVIAMFAGQLINLFILHRALVTAGASLLIKGAYKKTDISNFVPQYLPLVAAAVFMQVAPPVGTAMASTLQEGSVAALGLGSKVVIFISGLTGAAITSVVLPYFARHLAQSRILHARRELSFLLLAGTVISIPFAFALHAISPTFIQLVFEGGAFGKGESELVARVMAYGVLQLPFFVVNLLLLKFAIATRCSGRVMVASLFGLCIGVLFSVILMARMGVPGIALAMTFSAAGSALLLLLLFCRQGDVAWVDLLFIGANWGLFMTAMVCLHYNSYVGVIAAAFAYLILMLGEWGIFRGPMQAIRAT